jgi:HrpA-like RNA helicase
MNVELGQLVGYKMRFDDCTSANTKIKIMTDGILLEELRSDPMLLKYSIIIVDEAHERSLNIDFILGLLKDILKKRDDFKVLVSSATINAQLFSDYFNGAPVISVKTSPFPVEEKYFKVKDVEDSKEQISLICSIMGDIENKGEPGDVLIFLPGEGAIKDCCSQLEMLNRAINGSMVVMRLYARLSPEDQNRVFDVLPEGKRKVVVATNIAETSITINGRRESRNSA